MKLPRWLQTSPPQPVTGTPRHWHAILNGNFPLGSVSHLNSETSETSFSLSDGCDRHLPNLSGRSRSIGLVDSGVQGVNITSDTYLPLARFHEFLFWMQTFTYHVLRLPNTFGLFARVREVLLDYVRTASFH